MLSISMAIFALPVGSFVDFVDSDIILTIGTYCTISVNCLTFLCDPLAAVQSELTPLVTVAREKLRQQMDMMFNDSQEDLREAMRAKMAPQTE